ncbi:exopolysaccharide biosynthesis polyprenyl glycosylphosphotransferase [Candidatus Uabimicrobium sp. HlEnr_7]|uniref:exopolysaccharide biosynthesis polyprenyl glycosylphosphotransferase n=1 Tax=Candidatus Uabimicrobium helgolandensis TaxID=3095367 RepID=UPI003558DDF5
MIKRSKRVWSLRSKILLLKIGDVLLLVLSGFLSFFVLPVYANFHYSVQEYWTILFLTILWVFISVISDSYNHKNLQKIFRSLQEPIRITIFCWIVYVVFYFFSPRNSLPRSTVLIYCFVSCLLTMVWRFAHFAIFSLEKMRQKIIILSKEKLFDFDQVMSSNYFEVTEVLSSTNVNKVIKLTSTQQIHRVIYNPKEMTENEIIQLNMLNDRGVQITSIYLFYEEFYSRVSLKCPDLFELLNTQRDMVLYKFLKRCLNLSGALIGLMIWMPLFPIIALFIKIDSPGPIFFSQIRRGKNGKDFRLWKLRTMFVVHETNETWTQSKDPRITRVGKLLRKTRIDELPQLWNVLCGNLSLVGVRPLSADQCERFARKIPYHNLRHHTTPGITGWAVINQGYVNSDDGAIIRLEYDLFYIKNCSIWLDILILLRTISIVITLKGL